MARTAYKYDDNAKQEFVMRALANAGNVTATAREMGIPEETIKSSIADILHEGNLPKDWGGEKSDLFTCNISVGGRFMPSAFLLKGPAKFLEMKMSHLGKNGDQIRQH